MPRSRKVSKTTDNYLSRIEGDLQSNQSKLNMVLGALIVLVVGILVFNYFNKPKADLGPAQSTTSEGQDVSVENLPGKYTVREGDTLFAIADKYYKDGYQYTQIAKANNLTHPDALETGQVLDIPKLETTAPEVTMVPSQVDQWGSKITENTYTVTAGDWLSTIAGRAYGDVFAYQKIAEANHIANSDLIEVGQVLSIPR